MDRRYRFGEKLGRGAFGTVYKAFDYSNNVFAIKVMDKNDPTARQELEALTRAQHKHIIKCFEAISMPTQVWLVLEFADVGTMTSAIRKRTCNTEEFNVWRTIWQMASALDYLHKLRPHILHRLFYISSYLTIFD